MSCPSLENLALYARGQLNLQEQAEISAHLAQPCPSCCEWLEWDKQQTVALSAPQEKLPERLKEKARQLYRQSIFVRQNLPRLIFTQLIFDSNRSAEFAQTRTLLAASSDVPRRVIFRADLSSLDNAKSSGRSDDLHLNFDIDVEIQYVSRSNKYNVRGLLLFDGDQEDALQTLRVDLFHAGGQRYQSTVTNQLSEFCFSDVPEGNYTLQISLTSFIAVASIQVNR